MAGSTPPPEDQHDRVRALRARREEQSRVFRRRRLIAIAIAIAALILVLRAVLDKDNFPPPFTQGANTSAAPVDGASAAAPAAPEPVRLTVAASGDLLIHEPVAARALEDGGGDRYDFRPMFEQIKPWIEEADLAICHVEVPMTDAPPTGYPVFNAPPDLAGAISDTGWDACSMASNHTLDQGQEGIEETTAALDRADVAHAGAHVSEADSRRTTMLEADGVQVALLAYTEMTNGIPLPEPWSVDLAKAREILADARQAREDGADAVLVNLHAGEEYVPEPSESQRELARELTASDDVTAVIGQHVHVPQPIDEVNGKMVVYGEGNLVSNQTEACCPAASQDGYIALLDLEIRAEGESVRSARYVPVHVQHPDFVVQPVGDALDDEGVDTAALAASYERTREVVGQGPRIRPVPAQLPRTADG